MNGFRLSFETTCCFFLTLSGHFNALVIDGRLSDRYTYLIQHRASGCSRPMANALPVVMPLDRGECPFLWAPLSGPGKLSKIPCYANQSSPLPTKCYLLCTGISAACSPRCCSALCRFLNSAPSQSHTALMMVFQYRKFSVVRLWFEIARGALSRAHKATVHHIFADGIIGSGRRNAVQASVSVIQVIGKFMKRNFDQSTKTAK